jgi:hypothetical protein
LPSPIRPLQKWELLPPSDHPPLNKRLGVPGFFPLRPNAPEENLTPLTIEQGYKEKNRSPDVCILFNSQCVFLLLFRGILFFVQFTLALTSM